MTDPTPLPPTPGQEVARKRVAQMFLLVAAAFAITGIVLTAVGRTTAGIVEIVIAVLAVVASRVLARRSA